MRNGCCQHVSTSHQPPQAGHQRGIDVINGDARHAEDFARDAELRAVIDFTRPVGLLFIAVLHFVTDGEDPWGSVASLRDLMAPGSYLVLSHGTSDGSDPAALAAVQQAYEGAAAPAVFRAESEIGRFFDGFRLVYPGITDVSEWHPIITPQPTPGLRIIGGVGEKTE